MHVLGTASILPNDSNVVPVAFNHAHNLLKWVQTCQDCAYSLLHVTLADGRWMATSEGTFSVVAADSHL